MPFLYRMFFYPLAYVVLQVLRPFLKGKTRQMIEDKNKSFFEIKKGTAADIATQKPFWIHAASGEIEYARPILRALKNKFPQIPVIITFSSPSAKKILQGLTEVDAWGSLPWDFPAECEQFLEKWQPRAFLIARTDVWPVMAEKCRQKNIPSLLFAATFAANSSRLKGPSAKITRWALNQLAEIHCVSTEDLQQVQILQLKTPVKVMGDTRFDQVFHRLQHPKPVKKELAPSKGTPVLVAGSTWPEDEKVLLPSFAKIKNSCKMILAPHEIHESHLSGLEKSLRELGLNVCRYSQSSQWQDQEVLILDQMGILAELYTWGSFAFVGGSFKKQVHSVMEPLAAGLPVIVGPYHQNNREALHFKSIRVNDFNVVTEVNDIAEMSAAFEKVLENMPSSFHANLRHELSQHMHSSEAVVDWCTQSLN